MNGRSLPSLLLDRAIVVRQTLTFIMNSSDTILDEDSGPALVAFGNPLLDIIVTEGCEDLVKKYGLVKNIAQEMETLSTGIDQEVINM